MVMTMFAAGDPKVKRLAFPLLKIGGWAATTVMILVSASAAAGARVRLSPGGEGGTGPLPARPPIQDTLVGGRARTGPLLFG
jgi:hypothetical protein